MSDLVERLRDDGELINKLAQESGWNSCYEAADEIERQAKRIAELEDRIELLTAANEAILSESTDEIERLRAALQSIVGQTDDCEADETYYGGVWREVNHTAKHALREDEG